MFFSDCADSLDSFGPAFVFGSVFSKSINELSKGCISLGAAKKRSRGTIVRGTLLGKERQARRESAAAWFFVPQNGGFYRQKKMGLNL